MKYLCLKYHAEDRLAAMSEAERRAYLDECREYDEALKRGGHYLGGETFLAAEESTTLRLDGAQVAVTAGPPPRSTEQLGNLFVLEARDLNHVIQLTANLPCMRLGGHLEIRPMHDDEWNGV
jgi:hypothetical protein